MSSNLGFVGLGIMGQAMALNVMRPGEGLSVYNRTQSRTVPLKALGATVAASPREVAEASSVVFLMVTDDEALSAVTGGPEGLFAGAHAGLVIVDHSTVSPTMTRQLADQAEALGASWCDAPVTGGDVGARQATLTMMVGATEDDFHRIEPLLQRMAKRILRVGGVGQGQSLKLVANMVSALNLMAAAEGLQFGLHQGLALEDLATVLNFGSAASFEVTKVLERYRTEDYSPGFSVANRLKDFRLALKLAEETGFSADMASGAMEFYQKHAQDGFMDQDESSYVLRWGASHKP